MPFKSPFKKKIYLNDLVYGLAVVREYYLLSYKEFKTAAREGNIRYINTYPVTKYEQIELPNPQFIPNNLNSFLGVITSHPKYKQAITANFYTISMYSNKQGLLACDVELPGVLKRKSKAGLYWAAQNSEEDNHFNIHFLLDDINFKEVVTKSNSKDNEYPDFKAFAQEWQKHQQDFQLNRIRLSPPGKIKERSITSAELRWIYRNRFDPKVQKVIQFWYKGKPCGPPWEKKFDRLYHGAPVSKLWFSYVPSHMDTFNHENANTSNSSILERLFKFCK